MSIGSSESFWVFPLLLLGLSQYCGNEMAVKICPMEKKFEDEIHYILHVYGFANSYVMKREAVLIFIGDYGERGKK